MLFVHEALAKYRIFFNKLVRCKIALSLPLNHLVFVQVNYVPERSLDSSEVTQAYGVKKANCIEVYRTHFQWRI